MKFRDLFNKKNISRFLMLGIVLFLFLPLIYPEEKEFKIIKKENVYEHETSPLPIFKKGGLLGKYANKLKNFYKIKLPILNSKDEKTNQITEYNDDTNLITQAYNKNQNIDITKEDLFFPSAFDNEDDVNLIGTNGNVANKNESNTVNLQKGTVLTNDGSTLEPTKEGYYHKGKFYKNGTYPKNANKKHIEGALSRYHSSVAKKLGKKAVYLADENGNLTVSYENELPDQIATDIDTYLAQNQNKYQQIKPSQNNTSNTASEKYNQYEKYNNSQIVKSNNQQIDDSDISIASIKDMHSAYDLIKQKINTNQIGQGIDLNKPLQNAIVDIFLNNNNNTSSNIIPDKPNDTPLPPTNPANGETIIAGDQDFAQNYADKIHELNCGQSTATENIPQGSSLISSIELPFAPPIIQLDGNNHTISCDIAPLLIEPSSAITNNISQESDLDKFKEKLNGITNQSEKTDINIISTDRNFYPVASALNSEESIRNSNDEPVKVHIIGPNEEEKDLSKVLEGVTYSITDDIPSADKLNSDLSNYYFTTHNENSDTHTVLAFPTDDKAKVFVLTDPNNSYWLNNPRQLENLPTQYMERNGVYYKGIIVDKTEIGNLVKEEKTNLLYVSDQDHTEYLNNGSALVTVKEDDIKINSLHPEQIQKNTEMVRNLTQKGQETLQKNQQQELQPINIIDLEKGNKKIQPQT